MLCRVTTHFDLKTSYHAKNKFITSSRFIPPVIESIRLPITLSINTVSSASSKTKVIE